MASGTPAHLVAGDLVDHPLGLGGRHLEQREALEHADVAHRLAVEAGGGGDRADHVGGLEALAPAGADDQLDQLAVELGVGRLVGLGVPARLRASPGPARRGRSPPTARA